jgi:hypothetical protein
LYRYITGFVLSFLCLGLGAVQSNIADKCLRDHGATVNENMLYTNALGAVIVFGRAGRGGGVEGRGSTPSRNTKREADAQPQPPL